MYHYRLCFYKKGDLRFISHLDLLRMFIRALRRASIPVAYSKGFNPQPRLSFAAPLAVGMEGENEYLDLYLSEPWKEETLKDSLNKQLPPELKIKKIKTVKADLPPVSAVLGAALYVAELPFLPSGLLQEVQSVLSREEILKVRKSRKAVKKVNIRPFIYDLQVRDVKGKGILLMLLAAGSKGGVRPQEILELMPVEGDIRIYRKALFLGEKDSLKTPEGIESGYYLSEEFCEERAGIQ